MKHAGPESLTQLETLLVSLRGHGGLVERTAGSFYKKSKAYLHFHEDPAGLFADVKLDGVTFTRFEVTSKAQQKALLGLVTHSLTVKPSDVI